MWQDGAQNAMFLQDRIDDQVVKVPMEARPFHVRVPRQPKNVVIKVGAWPDESIFRLQPDTSTEPTQFGLGKGMAAYTYGSGDLVLTKEAHNAYAGDRLERVGDRDAIFVSTLTRFDPDQTSSVTDQDEDLFVVVYIDKNNDEIVDFDEYEYLVLNF